MITSSITDKPRNVSDGERDNFGIEPFENGLTKFINTSSTPITIALQGEWGSGKTSLMNSLKNNLSDIDNSKFHSIWLNTWEYALMKDAQSTLMDIILGLIKEVTNKAKVDESVKKKMFSKMCNVGASVLKTGLRTVGNKAIDGLGDATIDEFLTDKSSGKISEIRAELEDIIETCIKRDNKQGFIFFIDDLDRIDPPVAVQLLELLKNIFTLKNCVFVLAIDYDVVIKGLEPKFGKLTALNEREFRSFFDKIIQVPFSMPISRYDSNQFLKESLVATNYINETIANNPVLISKFAEISNLSVGKNPRALKRLMNSLSLINCINATKNHTEENDDLNSELELLVNFALVSIQIAFPPVYRLLSMYPNFDDWNENIALQMNLKQLDEQSINKLNQSEEFDEEWEQVLFRLCENDHYLKKQALNISRLLNSLRKSIEEKEEKVEDIIGAVISLSSVTNLEAFDKPSVDYHKGSLLKGIRGKLLPALREKLPEQAKFIKQKGTKIQSNFRFFSEEKREFLMNSRPKDGGINLYVNSGVHFGKKRTNFKTDLKNDGLFDEFETLFLEYDNYFSKNSNFTTHNLFDAAVWKNDYYINFHSDLLMPAPENFYTPESIDMISNHIIKINDFGRRFKTLAAKRIK